MDRGGVDTDTGAEQQGHQVVAIGLMEGSGCRVDEAEAEWREDE